MMHIGDRKPKVYLYGRNRVERIVILVSYCVQIAKCRVLEDFQGLKVRGRGLVNWFSRILEDEDFRRGQQLWPEAHIHVSRPTLVCSRRAAVARRSS